MKTADQQRAQQQREELQRAASYFGNAAEDVLKNPLTPAADREFLRRLVGNVWKVADWPTE